MPERNQTTTPGNSEGLPPEVHNDEQDPSGEQAQDVAADARREDSRTASPLESTRVGGDPYDPAPDSKGDLVDEMKRMEGAGVIDMSAFAGEPNHDDEPGIYGGETTDDDDAEWLTADGEDLSEAEERALPETEDDDDIDFAALADLIKADNDDDVEIPEDEEPDEIVPLPGEDPLPGDDEEE